METVKQPLMLMEIERELAGPNRESALAKYDAVLAKLDSRLGEALKEGLPPGEFPRVEALRDANELRSGCLARGEMPDAGQVAAARARYEAALDQADAEYARDGPFHPKYVPEGVALSARLRRYEDQHLLFLERADVPFTNNESERHLRCAKGKLKQSGGFRSTANGQAPYCDFLTVTRTALLRGESPYATVLGVFAGK